MAQRQFERALLIGSPDRDWPERLRALSRHVEVADPGPLFAERANGAVITEDRWEPGKSIYDLVLAIGTLDTVDDLPLALRKIRYSMRGDALLIGAVSGGETLPQLRKAIRAADAVSGIAAAHVHPRIEAAALAPLLELAEFVRAVVDVDRVAVSYRSLDRLVRDLRAMGATNSLRERPRFIGRSARAAAIDAFRKSGDGIRTLESFEILHFAAWTAKQE